MAQVLVHEAQPVVAVLEAGPELERLACEPGAGAGIRVVVSPASDLISVDLPEPFWPTRAWISLSRTSRSASIRARVPPERLG